jgi:putative oxidoreductase
MLKNFILLFARVLLAIIFLLSGLSKFGDYSFYLNLMKAQKIFFAEFFLILSGVLELCGGVCIFFGYKTKFFSLILFLYLIPVTFIFHFVRAFPEFSFSIQSIDRTELVHFLKNLGILSALIQLYLNGSGSVAIKKD